MNKKVILFFILTIVQTLLFAQCPVEVVITPNPSGATCKNTVINFTQTPTNGGTNPSYYWMVNGDTVGTASTFSTAVNGAHVELIMISNSGCAQDSAYTSYYINTITMEASYNVIIEECNQPMADVQITNINGGTPPHTYVLYTNEGELSGTDYFTDVGASSYPLAITDAENCKDTSWIHVVPKECPPIIPEEVFTPNEDGFNDTFRINNIEFYPKNKVFIFDRWGQRVYYKEGYENIDGWDAKYLASNMPVSTYYYVIELEFDKQEKQVFKGPVSILR
ncbi:MAG: gliding motility-associated C-terminal domain-containing protein [Bacteroidetes bacterium]|nr:gliding motility-associated C-terminal domain-containing protein [Bacteroidota bacterium]